MALVKCGECSNEVSDKATTCPKCGAPVVVMAAVTTPPAEAPRPAQATPAQAVIAVPPAKKGQSPQRRILTIGVLLGLVWLIFKLGTGSSLAGALRGPETIFNETVEVEEGGARGYGFMLPTSRRVDVEVKASPKKVNVMLMTEAQWEKYQKVKGNLFGGEYEFKQALSHTDVLAWTGTDILPAGQWRVVIERPREAVIFTKATSAAVKIVGH